MSMHTGEGLSDQAAGLRRMINVAPSPTQVIAVTSGKGGVGKTSVTTNLAISLARHGKDVIVLDADLGLGNVDVLLGLKSERNLSHAIAGQCSLAEVMHEGPNQIRILPGGSGVKGLIDLGASEQAGLIRAFSDPVFDCDVMLVDTAAGLTGSILTFVKACNEIVVVLCDEPSSITDAYALIKILSKHHDRHRFRILANQVRSARAGQALFLKLLKVASQFLDVSLDYAGAIPFDDCVHQSVRRQTAVVEAFPGSPVTSAFKKLAQTADTWNVPTEPSGHLAFFVERLAANGGRAGGEN